MDRLAKLALMSLIVAAATLAAASLLAQDGAIPAREVRAPANPHVERQPPPPAEKLTVHGGLAFVAQDRAFEVVYQRTGISVYVYDLRGEPLPVFDLKGSVTIRPKASADEAVPAPFTLAFTEVAEKEAAPKQPASPRVTRPHLAAETDLAQMKKDAFTAQLEIGSMAREGKPTVFELPFPGLAPEVRYACPQCKAEMVDPGDCAACKVKLQRIVKTEQS